MPGFLQVAPDHAAAAPAFDDIINVNALKIRPLRYQYADHDLHEF